MRIAASIVILAGLGLAAGCSSAPAADQITASRSTAVSPAVVESAIPASAKQDTVTATAQATGPQSGPTRASAVGNPPAAKPVTELGVRVCGRLSVRPTDITLTCADAGQIVEGITWDSWGPDNATGVGTMTTKLCEPTCAAGGTESRRVTVNLHTIVPDADGGQRFSIATVGSKGRFDDFRLA